MGYRGKVVEQERARELRAQGWTYSEICAELAVSKASVSLWCRDVEVNSEVLEPRRRARWEAGNAARRPSRLVAAKMAEIRARHAAGRARIGVLTERDLLVAGVSLYVSEGSKTDGSVKFANSDPRMIVLFLRFLRHFFPVEEPRLRAWLYLHEGLDLEAAIAFWSELTRIPPSQFGKPYRAIVDLSIRRTKHEMGCMTIAYNCSATHRTIMGMADGLLS